jgi:hypothetical protein
MTITRQRLIEQVIDHLRQQIATGTYPIGSRLAPLAPRAADAQAVSWHVNRQRLRVRVEPSRPDKNTKDKEYQTWLTQRLRP